jgi:hypothetical protein
MCRAEHAGHVNSIGIPTSMPGLQHEHSPSTLAYLQLPIFKMVCNPRRNPAN